eukprot:CAMPEP_0181231202 /NCGR_PEP_ID=MMETSP1096-20121128/34952_1 /TAXON_ID=156174 ORGANISM="Chrysochromulina ericina, Strain CCMP281" /NCGR_SAMPLE_ID=MMETSP1096 /ASSEMBLY_ACC=CAM_ASM_000453 /LENGTH=113 /DNA_ID=CAMNT_0023325171 /DNA_START=197 /DNA_END=539 /DNA_ORIENTATION=+
MEIGLSKRVGHLMSSSPVAQIATPQLKSSLLASRYTHLGGGAAVAPLPGWARPERAETEWAGAVLGAAVGPLPMERHLHCGSGSSHPRHSSVYWWALLLAGALLLAHLALEVL